MYQYLYFYSNAQEVQKKSWIFFCQEHQQLHMEKKRLFLTTTWLAKHGKLKRKCKISHSGSQIDSLSRMCSVKSPFLSCDSSDLTYTKSNLSFKPYTPEGVFTVFSLFLPWFSVYFCLKLKLLLSNCRSHQVCCNFSIWRSKLQEKIQQSLKYI